MARSTRMPKTSPGNTIHDRRGDAAPVSWSNGPRLSWITAVIHHQLLRFHQMNHGYGAAALVASWLW
jgi:hypothetical protein